MLFTFTNCQNLEYDESTGNREEDVFNDFARSKNFLTGIYAYLPTDYNSIDGAMRAAASDEAEHVSDLSDIQKFNEGSWSANLPLDNVWGTMYTAIRASNVFLKESAGQTFPEQQYNNLYKNIILQYNNYPYEARFLRAFFYFELVKRYKNIPLIITVLTPEEAVNVDQASFEEVINFIVSECDAISPILPTTYSNFSTALETGRATKGAAMALKARALLYAASPLHNTPTDLVLWEKAARAAKDIIDLNLYSLTTGYANNFNILAISPVPELIFERRNAVSNDFERRNFPIGYEGGNTGTCPTQNLVDAYEMARNGLPALTTNSSGYNPNSPYSTAGTSARDSRLGQTVIVNGSVWKNKPVLTYFGGTNGLPIFNATKTGYYLKKYVIEGVNLDPKLPTGITTREHTWNIFRYGEVLLNYAEAMNEAYGGPGNASTLGMTALQAVNLVRRRANPSFAGFLFPAGMSQDAFRTKLRNERRVELAFEDHRFWDIRRWKIGKETEDIYAMNITRDENSIFTYERKLLEKRTFDENKMYLYPIPLSEILKSNNKLKQNPGW